LIAIVAYRVALSQREATRWLFILGCVIAAVGSVAAFARWSESQAAQNIVVESPRAAGLSATKWLTRKAEEPSIIASPDEAEPSAPRPVDFQSRIKDDVEQLEAYHAQLEEQLALLANATGQRVEELAARIDELRREPNVADDCLDIRQELAQLKQSRASSEQTLRARPAFPEAYAGRIVPFASGAASSIYERAIVAPPQYVTARAVSPPLPTNNCANCLGPAPPGVTTTSYMAASPAWPAVVAHGYPASQTVQHLPLYQAVAPACPVSTPYYAWPLLGQ
jgi:hypothetical protein